MNKRGVEYSKPPERPAKPPIPPLSSKAMTGDESLLEIERRSVPERIRAVRELLRTLLMDAEAGSAMHGSFQDMMKKLQLFLEILDIREGLQTPVGYWDKLEPPAPR